jgi:AraC-like DNA-binding protein
MDTSERTLTRRLAAHGLNYRALIDDMRFKTARDRLRSTDEPITDIAASVGFDDPAHFTRMFRRMGGISPTRFRRGAQG